MPEEDEFDQVDSGRPRSKKGKRQREEEGEERERERESERRASPRRCRAGREVAEDHRSELGSAAPVVSGSLLPPVSPRCSPHQCFDGVDFDVELTAEVRLEGGPAFTVLSSVAPGVPARKSGAFTHRLPSLLNHPSLSWRPRLKGHLVDTCRPPCQSPCRPPASLPFQPRDASTTLLLKRSAAPTSAAGVVDAPTGPPALVPVDPALVPGVLPLVLFPRLPRRPGRAEPPPTAPGTPCPPPRPPCAPSLPLSPSADPSVRASSAPRASGRAGRVRLFPPAGRGRGGGGGGGGADVERILRVLDGDEFVSVRAEGDWQAVPRGAATSPARGSGRGGRQEEEEDQEEDQDRSASLSLTPPRPRSYDSDRFSEKPAGEALSLDGEALDSDYPSLEDSPRPAPCLGPRPLLPAPRARAQAQEREARQEEEVPAERKKVGPSEPPSEPSPARTFPPSPLRPPPPPPAARPARSLARQEAAESGKEREKGGKKEGGRSAKYGKAAGGVGGGGRKRKLQSKVSVLSLPPPPLTLPLPPSRRPPASRRPRPAGGPASWSLQTGVDCTAGGVLALTALLFKMEEANVAGRAKAHEFIQATSQMLSQANQSQSQQHPPASSSSSASSSQVPPLPSLAPPPAQFVLHGSLPLVGGAKAGLSAGGGWALTPPGPVPTGSSGGPGGSSETGWDGESKDPEKYLKKLHTQERAVEEVKLAIKPYYQRKDINKDEYKDILRKAVHKICHSRTGEINPVKVSNLVKLYVQRYKYFRKHGRRMDEEEREGEQIALHPFSS
ncbi:hypothetical protein ANANG_G00286800 [Anguilla anguilla]|uniref:SFR19-like C-terminal domain-containing protein n=1 Tax=Anguilla anguilla TaxID=7936 RepID=A0A9D3RLE3_ANGAN|nr:hypothetical protein ANANG_G00286800 [Anguilla anguilla]